MKILLVMKKIFCFFLTILFCVTAEAQSNIMVTFTGRTTEGQYVNPEIIDSITVENLTRGWKETLLWHDTMYQLNVTTGIGTMETKNDIFLHAAPNPFNATTMIYLSITEPDEITMEIVDMQGRVLVANNYELLQSGMHSFYVTLSRPGTYVLLAHVKGKDLSTKLINTGNGGKDVVEYSHNVSIETQNIISHNQKIFSSKGESQHPFQLGDQMRYMAFVSGLASADVTHSQNQSEEILLIFNTSYDGHPCPVTSTVTDYDGNVYNTVQIGNQCWMKENLRTTHHADGTNIALTTGYVSSTIAYCYRPDNSSSTVPDYGYLYNYAAVMYGADFSNTNPSGVQGICPDNWHIPSKAEWEQLNKYVSCWSMNLCDNNSNYIAKAISSTTGWESSTNVCAVGNFSNSNNITGFSALPAGDNIHSNSRDFGKNTYFWSTTRGYYNYEIPAYIPRLNFGQPYLFIDYTDATTRGFSVRCLRD